jgi:hypothetical protein
MFPTCAELIDRFLPVLFHSSPPTACLCCYFIDGRREDYSAGKPDVLQGLCYAGFATVAITALDANTRFLKMSRIIMISIPAFYSHAKCFTCRHNKGPTPPRSRQRRIGASVGDSFMGLEIVGCFYDMLIPVVFNKPCSWSALPPSPTTMHISFPSLQFHRTGGE